MLTDDPVCFQSTPAAFHYYMKGPIKTTCRKAFEELGETVNWQPVKSLWLTCALLPKDDTGENVKWSVLQQ